MDRRNFIQRALQTIGGLLGLGCVPKAEAKATKGLGPVFPKAVTEGYMPGKWHVFTVNYSPYPPGINICVDGKKVEGGRLVLDEYYEKRSCKTVNGFMFRGKLGRI